MAFLIRLAAVAVLRDVHAPPGQQAGADGLEFNRLALNLAVGEGYALTPGHPTSFRAPGFPVLLSAVYRLAGERYLAAYLLFCALGAASCVLTYALCIELMSANMARCAAALSAAYVPQIYNCTVFLSENLFVVTLAAFVWLQVRSFKSPSVPLSLAAGLALGASILTRPFALLLAPCSFLLMILAPEPPLWRRLAHASVVVAGISAVLAPWAWRNERVHHAVVLVATNGGSTFYGGNNDVVLNEPRHFGGWVSTGMLPGRNLVDATTDEVSHDKMEWQLGFQWVRAHLSAMPRLLFYKLARFCLPEIESGNRKYVLLQLVGATPFLLLTYTGMALTMFDRRYWTPCWLTLHGTILASVVTALIFWGSPRFRDANTPLLMLYAALGLSVYAKAMTPFFASPEKARLRHDTGTPSTLPTSCNE